MNILKLLVVVVVSFLGLAESETIAQTTVTNSKKVKSKKVVSSDNTVRDEEPAKLGFRKIRVLDISGTPYERGLSHGQELKAEIHETISKFKKDLERTYKVKSAEFIKRFLAETDFKPAIEKWTPGLLDEVRGIADGAGLEFDDVYVFQLADEIWSMGSWAMKHKCTAIAVNRRGDQPTLVAQNMDIPGFYQKYPTLMRVERESGPDTMVLTCPGLIGVNGMNSASIAVCCNTLLQLKPSRTGLPCLFVVRGVLEQKSLENAEAWLKRIPHAVGQNYTLGDPTCAKAFECSASKKVRFQPNQDGDFTYHTNHPLVNEDWHPDYVRRCEQRGADPKHGLRICRRFEALQKRIQMKQPIDETTIVDALASRDHLQGPICGNWNYACTVFVLRDKPELHISPGRPDRFGMQSFGFD